MVIKAEVQNILDVGFIYPVPLTKCMCNIVLVTKKQGNTCVCVDYQDLNRSYLKDNYPTTFIDQNIDDCDGSELFSFMDGFLGYNQIDISPSDQYKNISFSHGGCFLIKSFPLA